MERKNNEPAAGDGGTQGDHPDNQVSPIIKAQSLPQAQSAWKRAAIDTLIILRAKFPQCFARLDHRSRRPLKLKIHADILAAAPEIDPSDLGKALRLYTHHAGYLAQCVEGKHRIGLLGEAAGAVTAPEAEHAAALLAKVKNKPRRQTRKRAATGIAQ